MVFPTLPAAVGAQLRQLKIDPELPLLLVLDRENLDNDIYQVQRGIGQTALGLKGLDSCGRLIGLGGVLWMLVIAV